MDKLELKYIVPYLPYGLRGNLINPEYYKDVINGELFRIETGLTTKHRTPNPMVIVNDNEDCLFYFKPILRPLSDLTDEMAIKSGYKNVNALRLMIISGMIPYIGMVNLLSNHFDVFGLIPANLAIDIKTINP